MDINIKEYISENEILMQEWDYEANIDLNPNKLKKGSNKKAHWVCKICGGRWQAAICDRVGKKTTGCPYCAGQKVLKGYNDLKTKFPDIAREWHPNKNGDLLPEEVMGGSGKKAWWLCPNGHEYEQTINKRTSRNSTCPICSGRKVKSGVNDLGSLYPTVAAEWHSSKNGNLTPSEISRGSNKKYWWQCRKCGYEWQARVADRTIDNNGCPACANKVVVLGFNDLESQFPEIAKEWNYEKNGDLKPNAVTSKSAKKVWWKCSFGHEYLQGIELKTVRQYGCPYCAGQKVLKGYNDLKTTHPDIASEWHPTKNRKLQPQDVAEGSIRKVWWICSEGHEFEQVVNKRTRRGQSCPYCSGHKAWKGFNDFATKFPELAKEWHPTKNGSLKPLNVTYGSGKKVWWKCPVGHEYQAIVRDRGVGGTNCPVCNLRRKTSFGEQAIFFYIKKVFRDALNGYRLLEGSTMELDIFIPSINVAIEYDGGRWHSSNAAYKKELKKYDFCKKNNILLYRVKENNNQHWEDVADKIYYVEKVVRNDIVGLEKVIKYLIKDISPFVNLDINVKRDRNEILSYLTPINPSLADERPDVAEKWNFERNGTLKPNMFTVSSNEIVWWKCSTCGNEWETSINSMTREGRFGCAICSRVQQGKTFTKGVVKKVGSLAETNPELAEEWHPTKNGDLTPYDVTAGKFKPVWWLCKNCGFEWVASPNNRKKGVGCPCCSGRVPKIGVNDLGTKFPEIAKEWDYEKNYPNKPNEFLPGSGKKVWWKCSICGKSWEGKICSRTQKNIIGCRSCKRKMLKK